MFNLNLKKKNGLAQLGCTLLLTAATGTASAALETESNNIFADANFATPGTNSGIIGDLTAASNDVDIWKFDLAAGGRFGASISDGAATDFGGPFAFDPIIVLFMEGVDNSGGVAYRPVAANDPFAFSTTIGFEAWESGTYFLTVSAFANSPQDAFGNNQYDSQFWTTEQITGTTFSLFNSENPGQQGSFVSFDYNLSLNGITETPAAVPVPAAVWLFGSGLLGLAGVARRSSRRI